MAEKVERAQMGKVRGIREVWRMEGARKVMVRGRGPGRDVGIVEGIITRTSARSRCPACHSPVSPPS